MSACGFVTVLTFHASSSSESSSRFCTASSSWLLSSISSVLLLSSSASMAFFLPSGDTDCEEKIPDLTLPSFPMALTSPTPRLCRRAPAGGRCCPRLHFQISPTVGKRQVGEVYLRLGTSQATYPRSNTRWPARKRYLISEYICNMHQPRFCHWANIPRGSRAAW